MTAVDEVAGKQAGRAEANGVVALAPAPAATGATMVKASRYLLRNGLMVIAVVQPAYRLIELIRTLAHDAKPQLDLRIPLTGPFFRGWSYVRLRVDGDEATLSLPVLGSVLRYRTKVSAFVAQLDKGGPALTLIAAYLACSSMFSLLSLPFYIAGQRLGWAVLRSWVVTLRTALTAVPVLLAILVIIFATGDAWRLYGDESATRFLLLILIVLLVSVAAMVNSVRRADGGWRQAASLLPGDVESRRALIGTRRSRRLGLDGVLPVPAPGNYPYLSAGLRANCYVLFWFTLVLQLLSIALLVSLAFLVIGMVAVDTAATKGLLQAQHFSIIGQFNFLGQQMILSRPLLLLSVTFGSVASLTVAADLQNREKLGPFLATALVQHRRSLAVLACYEAVVLEQARQVFSRDFIRKIDPARRQALARLTHDLLIKVDPQIIDSGLNLVRALRLTDLASGLGLSVLLAIPPDKLRALQATGVDFVLAAAATADPSRSAEIQCVRDRRDLVLKNWRREWVRPGTHAAI